MLKFAAIGPRLAAAALVAPLALTHGPIVTSAVLVLLLPLPAGWITARTLDRYRLHVAPSQTGV